MTKELIAEEFKKVQDFICSELEKLDGLAKFKEDLWDREGGGGGRTRIIKNGNLLEKGGVAFSAVGGPVTTEMKTQLNHEGDNFFATGVSIVLHPANPHVPIIHMNIRYFQIDEDKYWFGGGIDLTPHYVVPQMASMFHKDLKNICDKYTPTLYTTTKEWADQYFYNKHRNESRGIGGIFFDSYSHLNTEMSKEQIFNFAVELGMNFVSIYAKQVQKGRGEAFTSEELLWRNLRRGRYVEFNLVYDRGTKYGLHSNGRTESILMSLPATAQWEYDFKVSPDSEEAKTLEYLQKKNAWI